MKRVELATNGVWVLNFLAAFGILLFAFLFLVFKQIPLASTYAATAKKMPPPVKAEGPVDRGRFAPVWATKLGDVTIPPPTSVVSGLETKIEIAGVMKMSDRKRSIAFVNILSGGDQQRVKEGDSVLGAKTIEIRSASVVFDEGGGRLKEIVVKRAALTSKIAGPKKGTDNPTQPGEFKTKKTSETADRVDWDVDPRELDYVTANAEALLGQMKLRPYAAEGGEMAGLAVDDITPGSFAAERGILKGDVIKSVDGQTLTSIDDVKKMAASGEGSKKGSTTITIERAGRKVDFVFKTAK